MSRIALDLHAFRLIALPETLKPILRLHICRLGPIAWEAHLVYIGNLPPNIREMVFWHIVGYRCA